MYSTTSPSGGSSVSASTLTQSSTIPEILHIVIEKLQSLHNILTKDPHLMQTVEVAEFAASGVTWEFCVRILCGGFSICAGDGEDFHRASSDTTAGSDSARSPFR